MSTAHFVYAIEMQNATPAEQRRLEVLDQRIATLDHRLAIDRKERRAIRQRLHMRAKRSG